MVIMQPPRYSLFPFQSVTDSRPSVLIEVCWDDLVIRALELYHNICHDNFLPRMMKYCGPPKDVCKHPINYSMQSSGNG